MATRCGFLMTVPHLVIAGLIGKFGEQLNSHRGIAWFCVALLCKTPSAIVH